MSVPAHPERPPGRSLVGSGGANPQLNPMRSRAQVFCNGVEVMTVGGTKPEYAVDIYSGNHPFYQGNTSNMVMDEGQLN